MIEALSCYSMCRDGENEDEASDAEAGSASDESGAEEEELSEEGSDDEEVVKGSGSEDEAEASGSGMPLIPCLPSAVLSTASHYLYCFQQKTRV